MYKRLTDPSVPIVTGSRFTRNPCVSCSKQAGRSMSLSHQIRHIMCVDLMLTHSLPFHGDAKAGVRLGEAALSSPLIDLCSTTFISFHYVLDCPWSQSSERLVRRTGRVSSCLRAVFVLFCSLTQMCESRLSKLIGRCDI